MPITQIEKDLGQQLTGFRITVGTSAVQLTATDYKPTRGVALKAAAANSGTIYVGGSNAVTAGGTAATDGYPLAAGDEIFLPVDPRQLWAIGSAAGQNLAIAVV